MPNRAADHLVHVPQVRAHRLRHADAVAGIGSRTVEIDRIGFEMVEDHRLILLESAARQEHPLARAARDRLVARIAEHADNTAVFLEQALGTRREKAQSEEHTFEIKSLMRNSAAVFCLQKKKKTHKRQ